MKIGKKLLAAILCGVVMWNTFPTVGYAAEMSNDEIVGQEVGAGELEAEVQEVEVQESENEDALVVEENPHMYGTSSNNATAIYAGNTITADFMTNSSETVHWYKFTTTKRGYFTVNLKITKITSGFGWGNLCIYEDVNADAVETVSFNSSNKECASKKLSYKPGKTVYISVDRENVDEQTAYELTINQTAAPNWEMEDNNSFGTANAFVNGEICGCITRDSDYYSFNVSKKSKLHMKLLLDKANIANVPNGWDVYLYKAGSSSCINSKTGWNTESTWTPKSSNYNSMMEAYPDMVLDPGTYYIVVDTFWQSNGEPYHLKYSLETVETQSMYRMYNPNSGEHFYTANAAERDNLKAVGWNYEGVAWTAPKKSSTPVYRVYNKNSGEHHYTTNIGEKNVLLSLGWNDEGIGWYSDDNMGTPLYRLYNPNAKGAQEAGAHHYTTNVVEKNSLYEAGWHTEGYGWYGM